MDIKTIKDKELITEALQKGRINCDAEGKVKITYNLASNVVATIDLQVSDVSLAITEK